MLFYGHSQTGLKFYWPVNAGLFGAAVAVFARDVRVARFCRGKRLAVQLVARVVSKRLQESSGFSVHSHSGVCSTRDDASSVRISP